MLSTVAPRWPRAFSVIGFGAAAILILATSLFNAFLPELTIEGREAIARANVVIESATVSRSAIEDLKASTEILQKNLEEPYSRMFFRPFLDWLRDSGPSETFLFGVVAIFVAYTLGEMVLALGRSFWILPNGALEIAMLGRLARIESQILMREYENYSAAFLVLQGAFALVVIWIGGNMLHLFETWDFAQFLKSFLIGLLLLALLIYLGPQNRRYVEADLTSYETRSAEKELEKSE